MFNLAARAALANRNAVFASGLGLVGSVAWAGQTTASCEDKGPTAHTQKWYFYTGTVNPTDMEEAVVFSGTSNPHLAAEVSAYLGVPLDESAIGQFADGEVRVNIKRSVRGKSVFLIQPVCRSADDTSVNDALVELLLTVSAMRRASAKDITAVIPYYGYARQDRKMESRVPISAADVAQLLVSMGVDRVTCIDLHCGQIQGFFPPNVPVDNLNAGPVGAAYFSEKDLVNPVVVSPDAGGVARAKEFRSVLQRMTHTDPGLAMIVKQRQKAGEIERMDFVGEVAGSDVIIVDDMIDTAGTLCKAAQALKDNGARRVFAFATHGLFSGPAATRINNSCMEEVVISNTVPLPKGFLDTCPNKVTQLSLAPLIAEAIKRLHTGKSMSGLFRLKNESK